MRLGIAADHGGFELKEQMKEDLKVLGLEVVDYGAHEYVSTDDFPDLVVPLARAVAQVRWTGASPFAAAAWGPAWRRTRCRGPGRH